MIHMISVSVGQKKANSCLSFMICTSNKLISQTICNYELLILGDVPVVCTEGEFKCNNDGCVTNDVVCDDYDDCGDQSDERGCCK